jgi:DNA-binding CsgD family transcriptional regulator/tetratricopeptide (TPR) repeat protein
MSVVCRDFIGRSVELAFLVERLQRLSAGRGSSVLIQGSAGVGKSRLLRELIEAARRSGVRCVESGCTEFGDSPYAPVFELSNSLGIRDAADVLKTNSGAAPNAAGDRAQRFARVGSAFAAAAAAEPFIAVVEDLHWAQPASLELLRYLMSALRDAPALIIFTERGEEVIADPAVIRALELIERDADAILGLRSLSPAEIKQLVVSTLRSGGRRIPTIAVEEIAELSDGRPFHAEELLRGILDRSDAAGVHVRVHVPRSLRAAVVERLSRFDEQERIVLAHCAVVGTRFEVGFLAELLNLHEREVLPILRKARNAQLVVEETDGGVFSFRHALTREVVYDEILLTEARALHLQIANMLIERGGDAIAIAYHAWRSGDPRLTGMWNVRCGDSAAAQHAHVDAIRHFERAFGAAEFNEERSVLAERLGAAYYTIGNLTEALAWLQRAIQHAAPGSDRAHRLALDRGRILCDSGAYDEGIACAKSVTDALSGRDSAVRYEAETRIAGLLGMIGRHEEAYCHLEAARAVRSEPDAIWVASNRGITAQVLHGLGRIDESARAFREAEAASRIIGDRDLLIRTLHNAACFKCTCGDMTGAIETFEAALTVARETQSARRIASLQQNLAYFFVIVGRFADAVAAYREAAAIDHGVSSVDRWLAAISARLQTLTGRTPDDREPEVEAAFSASIRVDDPYSVTVTAGAALLRRQARGENGDAIAEQFLATDARADEPWIGDAAAKLRPDLAARIRIRLAEAAAPEHALGARATLALFDARIAARERRRDDVEAAAKTAVTLCKQIGWVVHEAHAREIRGGIKEAIEIFRRIGAHAEVARLTNVDERAPRKRGETTLTAREREIANQIVAGKTNREVAEALVISERTVETHVASIYGKLGVSNRKDLIALLKPSG